MNNTGNIYRITTFRFIDHFGAVYILFGLTVLHAYKLHVRQNMEEIPL